MSTSSTLSPLPRHFPQSDSSSTTSAAPKSGTLVFQLALGAFVGLVQRFVEYHFGFGWLRPSLINANSVLPALGGVFGAFGSAWLEIDSSPPMQLMDSDLSLIEAPLEAEDSSLALNHIRRMNSTFDGDFELGGHTNGATYAYALLVCIIVAFSAGVWLVLRRSAQLENAFSSSATTLTGSGDNKTIIKASKVHKSSGEKRNAPKQGRGSNRRGDFGTNDDECPKGDVESDLSEGDDDDDDDDDDPPPPPPGSGSEFQNDDEGHGKLWTVFGGSFILGSIVMGMWKLMRWLRWATSTSGGERGLEDRSFGATIGMEKYENEWDVLTGSYRPSIPCSTARPSTLWPAVVSMPAILPAGPNPLAASTAAPYLQEKPLFSIESSTAQDNANIGTVAKKRKAGNIRMEVSKLKVRLRNLVHEFVETFGLIAIVMLFVFSSILRATLLNVNFCCPPTLLPLACRGQV